MTVSTTTNTVVYRGNGVATEFTVPFKVLDEEHLVVERRVYATGEVDLTYNSGQYSYDGIGENSGTLTLSVTALTDTYEVVIRRVVEPTQLLDIVNAGGFYPETIEEQLDRTVMSLQEAYEQASRAIRMPVGSDGIDLGTDLAGKFITFNAFGVPILTTGSGSDGALRADIASTSTNMGADLVASAFTAIRPEDDGAVGDGVTDDTTALIAAIARLTGKRKMLVLRGTYLISGVLVLSGLSNFVITGGGTIKVADGTNTNENYSIFHVYNCTDFLIENLTLDGNRDGRTPVEASGHLVRIRDGARGTFRKLVVKNGTTDGLYMYPTTGADQSTYAEDMVFEDCICDNNYRNGMSIIGAIRPKIIRGRYINTNGTAPQDGIDIEPNAGDTYGVTDLQILDVDVSDNEGYGLQLAGNATGPITRSEVRIWGRGNTLGLCGLGTASDIELKARCEDHSGAATRGLVDVGSGISNIDLDLEFRNITVTDNGSRWCVYVHSAAVNVRINRLHGEASTLPTLFCRAPNSNVRNVHSVDCTSGASNVSLDTGATRSTLRGVTCIRSTGVAVDVLGTHMVLEGLYLEDCASTTASLYIRAGATFAVLRGIKVHQTVSVPGGAVAVRCSEVISEITALYATGGYTSSNIITATAANYVGTKVSNISPDPFSGSTSVNLASIAAGGTTTGTVALTLANTTDRVHIQPQADLAGIQLTAWVSPAGTINYRATNPTTGAIDNAAQTWTFSLLKG